MFFPQCLSQIEKLQPPSWYKCCDIGFVVSGYATLVQAYFEVLRAVENGKFGRVKSPLPQLFARRRVVLLDLVWMRWSYSQPIKALISIENAPWIFVEDT
jgi:hypothetical protein